MLLATVITPFEGRVQSRETTANGIHWTYSYTYNDDGLVETVTTPQGVWDAHYDSNGYLSNWQNFTYNFDEVGRPTGQVSGNYFPTVRINSASVEVNGTTTPGPTASVRINGQTEPVAADGSFSKTFTVAMPGWQTYTVQGIVGGAGYNGSDAVAEEVRQIFVPPASESLIYINGRRTGDARWTYTWNELDQLVSMVESNPPPNTPATRLDFIYDLEGRRLEKKVGLGSQTLKRITYLYDGWRLVRETEYNSTDARVAERVYTWGPGVNGCIHGTAGIGGLLEVKETRGTVTTLSLPIYDGIGNNTGLVDGNTGTRVATFTYGPFGEVVSVQGVRAASCPLRWQTKPYDEETGLVYFGKRYYDPKTRTWLTADPLREAGGVDLYAYCNNRPFGNFDPIGLAAIMNFAPYDDLYPLPAAVLPLRMDINGLMVGGELDRSSLGRNPEVEGMMMSQLVGGMLSQELFNARILGGVRVVGGVIEGGCALLYCGATGGAGVWFGGASVVGYAGDNIIAGSRAVYDGSYHQAGLEFAATRVLGPTAGNLLYGASQFATPMLPYAAARLPMLAGNRFLPWALENGSVGSSLRLSVAAEGGINYGALDSLGRPTGVTATITQDMIGTGSPALRSITPPGFQGGAAGQARGHLLGNQLGGSGSEIRNLVTLQQNPANSPVMRVFENQIRSAVEGGQVFQGSFTPVYLGDNLVPRGITIMGEGSGGFKMGISILNPAGL